MVKSTQSHQNNIFDINSTPFLDSWKSAVLAQAKLLGIVPDPTKPLDFKVLSDRIEEHLTQRSTPPMKDLEKIVNTSSDFATVLTSQEKLYLQKAKFYNIELNADQWCELTDLHMYDAVDSWERALKEAMHLGVNWKMNDYDPQGLELAIQYKEEELQEDTRQMRMQVNAYYYASRGC